jgi:2-haloalkanoic acid dehalogenase type II
MSPSARRVKARRLSDNVAMSAPYDLLTFDCYGTLIDWRGGIAAAFDRTARELGRSVEPDRILDLHQEIEPAVQAGEFRPYRAVLEETARRMGERLGWPAPADGWSFLPDSLARWQPFPDTVAGLRRLREAGLALGILSNVDDDLIAPSLELLDVDFEFVITAQQVRAYKPARAHFDAARERAAGRRWLHVAQSVFHDIAPAAELGVPGVWINRLDEPDDPRPIATHPDVAALAASLGGAR